MNISPNETFIQIFGTIFLKISGRAAALMDEPPLPYPHPDESHPHLPVLF
jgi:hypothetical protein